MTIENIDQLLSMIKCKLSDLDDPKKLFEKLNMVAKELKNIRERLIQEN